MSKMILTMCLFISFAAFGQIIREGGRPSAPVPGTNYSNGQYSKPQKPEEKPSNRSRSTNWNETTRQQCGNGKVCNSSLVGTQICSETSVDGCEGRTLGSSCFVNESGTCRLVPKNNGDYCFCSPSK